MNVAYHSSDSYSPVLGTSIASLLVNNKKADQIHIYVIEDKISDENKRKLTNYVESYGRDIHFIPMPDMNKEQNLGLKAVRSDWIFNSYCRLFLDQILPSDVERVLYLDSDVLVLGDLTELWNIDMQGKCAAGVIDCLGEKYYEMLEMSRTSRYCNSGVQLQDLSKWRKLNISNAIRDYVHKSGGYIFFMEQTVFNVVFQDNILILPPEYNTYTLMQCLSYSELIKLRKPRGFYKESDIQKAVAAPKIVHLTSTFLITNRAWFEITNHPEKERYNNYKKITYWKDTPGFMDDRSFKKKFVQFWVDCLPRKFVIMFAGIVYNTIRVSHIKMLMKKAIAENELL